MSVPFAQPALIRYLVEFAQIAAVILYLALTALQINLKNIQHQQSESTNQAAADNTLAYEKLHAL